MHAGDRGLRELRHGDGGELEIGGRGCYHQAMRMLPMLVSLGVAGLVALGSPWGLGAQAHAQPSLWQAPDGAYVDVLRVISEKEPTRLGARLYSYELSPPAHQPVALPGAAIGEPVELVMRGEQLVVRGKERAWRLAWGKRGLRVVGTARWSAAKGPPMWARPRVVETPQAAFDELAERLRAVDRGPGLARFFGKGEVALRQHFIGMAPVEERLPAAELLARWREGDRSLPAAVGTARRRDARCLELPAARRRAAWRHRLRDGVVEPLQDLGAACFDDKLQLVSVELYGAPAPGAPTAEPFAADDPVAKPMAK